MGDTCSTCGRFQAAPNEAFGYVGPMCICGIPSPQVFVGIPGVQWVPKPNSKKRVVIPVDEQRVREIVREEIARRAQEGQG